MSFDLLNPWMLAGLAGVSLPILAHLLSKKKYDIVPWGAMQFLELGRETRRRVRLEELLLLLLRILLICLIVFALSRPWASGGMFKHLVSSQARDVVIVIDGSFSMGWEDGVETPHQQAIEWAREFLKDLGSGDTVALLDARDQVREVIEKPTHDLDWVREELDTLPPPSGSSNLVEACTKAVQILSRTTNLDRNVIVLTDGQARCWSSQDANRWLRFDDLLEQPSVRPRIRMIDVTQGKNPDRTNFTVGPIKLSRELTVTEFPIRVSTSVRYSGGTAPITKRIDFEVNGETIPDRSVSIQLEPNGETTVEFEHRFQSIGSYLIGVSVEGDSLPGDNRSLAAISVAEALPVLLVDGDDKFDPTQSETFFAKAALSPQTLNAPWVRAGVVSLSSWDETQLSRYSVVILANVNEISPAQSDALRTFVGNGGGVMFTLGDRCDPAAYSQLSKAGLFPAVLREKAVAAPV
ncbi:MAG TPA: VWA domain-containing protein, partial [Planctomycetaceae bacterium]|nr:VWA domain-containing protein [Planctomycetaceae bacterium]